MARKRQRRQTSTSSAPDQGPIVNGVLQPGEHGPLVERTIVFDQVAIAAAHAAVASLSKTDRLLFLCGLGSTLTPEEVATLVSHLPPTQEYVAAVVPRDFLTEQLRLYNRETVLPALSALRDAMLSLRDTQTKGSRSRTNRARARREIIANQKAVGDLDDEGIYQMLVEKFPELVFREHLNGRDAILAGEREATAADFISKKNVFDDFRRPPS
jgi:hypothetical protein